MNIAGVTQTAQVLPATQPPAAQASGAEAYAPVTEASDLAEVGADAVNFNMQVSTQVMDMAQRQFEEAANELISAMAATTGVGGNIDVAV